VRPLTAGQAAQLADELRPSWTGESVLLARDPACGRDVALGRYRRDPRRRDTAEVAVTVVADWRRNGLGRSVLALLAQDAGRRGVRRFTAVVPVEDRAALALLRTLNAEVSVLHRGFGVVRYEVSFGQRFCKLCGRQVDVAVNHAAEDLPSDVCGECLRRYLPKVQVRLADPWWV
jgi:GNAT superfamily N-acetyltransferase